LVCGTILKIEEATGVSLHKRSLSDSLGALQGRFRRWPPYGLQTVGDRRAFARDEQNLYFLIMQKKLTSLKDVSFFAVYL
jgi:hypothetical protein